MLAHYLVLWWARVPWGPSDRGTPWSTATGRRETAPWISPCCTLAAHIVSECFFLHCCRSPQKEFNTPHAKVTSPESWCPPPSSQKSKQWTDRAHGHFYRCACRTQQGKGDGGLGNVNKRGAAWHWTTSKSHSSSWALKWIKTSCWNQKQILQQAPSLVPKTINTSHFHGSPHLLCFLITLP